MERAVCSAYCLNSFLLWYISVKARFRSIETRIVFSGTLVPSMKLMKSVVSLRYDFCCCAIGWSSLSTNADNLSVGPETPDIMGLPTGVGLCIFVRL